MSRAGGKMGRRGTEGTAGGDWFARGALLGGAVGLALGLLYAPRAGTETRRALARHSETLRQRVRQVADEMSTSPGVAPPGVLDV